MKWLIHGKLTGAVGDALRRHGHETHQPAELDLPAEATPIEILKNVEKKQWEIVTGDESLAHAPFEHRYPFARTIVCLQLAGGDVEQDDAIDRLVDRYKRLSPRRLYTVTGSRVKIRQLPGA